MSWHSPVERARFDRTVGAGLAGKRWVGGATPAASWMPSTRRSRLGIFRTALLRRSRRRTVGQQQMPAVHQSVERIERALDQLFRRGSFTAEEREDFHSWAWIKLLER